ncbi:para-aminobenzoate synthetase / 4-amino-4-deoxychorismate lyase [Polynucleobacter meluiroseus]|uniref:Para-aminobenzoate synthetase / 4-amino-4-deoxychorismate lyase n=1 Tax=Polynucleobacter meluiroseus TaxID=1938814 RepID=A0A240E202_9BURK|nr:bifunctional chorismate-binding protein/class IV aminotransferase [Polynucleobacter meluiroseus]SNX28506.1 para-aminobenzoate synthetase / 4-amino-4-deoxychorismate lyase [Polynucleobacter meluiroseus]
MILLDDAQSTDARPSSRLYQEPIAYWRIEPSGQSAEDVLQTAECLRDLEQALAKGEYVVAAFAYELGQQFHDLPARPSSHPLIEAWSFSSYQTLSKLEVDAWLATQLALLQEEQRLCGISDVQLSLHESDFAKDICTIQEYIRNGDVYQINHTFRITGKVYGSPLALYARLRARQPGRFGAYIDSGTHFILSQSPELFLQRESDTLKAMPMKGTANALQSTAEHLSSDPKNQAENVMIVDLLRNDLSRIAELGSVHVPALFSVAQHGDVLQMTSTIEAQAKSHLTLLEILNAVFPCGSVTGAPKKRSMEIIQELEPTDRGYYCGALGWFDPQGDFALSVPIRTVEIERVEASQASTFVLGVGAGITHDSRAQEEWEECSVKSAFLTQLPSQVGLFETILVKHGTAQMLAAHLQRMQTSAMDLMIPFNLSEAERQIHQAVLLVDKDYSYRLRLDLSPFGEIAIKTSVFEPLPKIVKVFWARDLLPESKQGMMYSGNPLLRHKTHSREVYDQAWQIAESQGGFDALFINEYGLVTEGGRTSVFIKLKGVSGWFTPPVSAGVLPGVMRAKILNDPHWNAREANLTIEDVLMADELMLTNALRGTITASF